MRRAKAAFLCGHETISATIGGIGDTIQVPVKNLLSPKAMIDDTGLRGGDWGRAYRGTQRGDVLPPIVVMPGAFGTPIARCESTMQAIHDIIIGTRYLAYKNTDPQILARILDRADPLSAALGGGGLVTEEQVAQFRLRLQDIEDNFSGFEFLVAKFDQNMKKTEARRELAAASV